MIHVLGHALGLVALGAVVWWSGRILLALRGLRLGAWSSLAGFCVGFAWWMGGLFVLAAAGILNLWGLGLVALPIVVLTVFLRPLTPLEGAAPALAPSRHGAMHRLATAVAIIVLAAVLLPVFFLTLSPQVSHDAAVYHLTLPRLYVENGGFRDVPMSVYSNWPLGTELLFAAAMLAGDYMLAKAVHFGFALLVVYALFVAVSAHKNGICAWLAGTLFLANEVVAFEIRVAYVDLAHAFFFLCAVLFLDRALDGEEENAGAFLLLSGICCGLTASVKVTGIAGAAVIAALYAPRLVAKARRGGLAAATSGFFVRFALPVAVLWVPWLVKSFYFTGNPFYPFFHDHLGGADWSATLSERFTAWQSGIGMGRDAIDYLLLPLRVILLGGRGYEHFDGRISPFWLVLVPLALAFVRRDPLVRRALAAAGLSFVIWAFSSQQMRFLIPTLALLSIAGAVSLVRLVEGRIHTAWRNAGLLALATILLVSVYLAPIQAGWRSLRIFLDFEGDLVETVVPAPLRFINETLAADARLLFLNVNRGFFCRREYLADSFFEASQIADALAGAESAGDVRRWLDGRRVTHVVLNARPAVENFPPALFALLNDPNQAREIFRSPDGRFAVLHLVGAVSMGSGEAASRNVGMTFSLPELEGFR